MAVGRVIAQVLLMGGTYVARAFIQAYQQALVNSSRSGAGAAGAAAAARTIRSKLSPDQASEILGVTKDAGLKDVYSKYDKLFSANDPTKGGSIYLQAKIHNAKTELERAAVSRGETPRQEQPESSQPQEDPQASSSSTDSGTNRQ